VRYNAHSHVKLPSLEQTILNNSVLKFFSFTYVSTGFITVLVAYSSAAAIVFQAASASGATLEQMGSWMWALGIGMGISSIVLSAWYRAPILIAWSTPGAALLLTSLPGIPMAEAIGAFIFSSLLCGVSGWVEKIMRLVPQSLASAMLAGILLHFILSLFRTMEDELIMVTLMLISYVLGKRYLSRHAILLSILTGVIYSIGGGLILTSELELVATIPVLTPPAYNLSTLIGVGFPLFLVTMTSQNVPGIAVLRAHGYKTPASPLVAWSGLTGLRLAPFGGFAFNLAAITAAICMGKEVDNDSTQRYLAAIWAGIFYLVMGVFGATVVQIIAVFPQELVMSIAGLALLTTTGNSLKLALHSDQEQEAALLTFAITASGIT